MKAHGTYFSATLMAFSGIRRGEALGLRWVDLDFETGVLTIRQQAVQVGHEVVFGAPKTRAGQRRVDLDEGTIAVLRGVRRRQAAERLRTAGSLPNRHTAAR